jgi:hypothetical protein
MATHHVLLESAQYPGQVLWEIWMEFEVLLVTVSHDLSPEVRYTHVHPVEVEPK